MPSTEQTPLLAGDRDDGDYKDPDAIYDRFTPRQKIAILATVSYCGVIPLFISGSFVPVVSQIAKEFGSTGAIASLAISVSIFARGLGSLVGGSYSTHYGRRPVYLAGLAIFCIGSIGVACSRSVPELILWCFIQTFGASPSNPVGAGVIGDIYRLEQRGTAMGIFFAAVLLGPTLAPLTGGLVSHYASWRAMQWALCFSGVLAFLCIFFFFPETSHSSLGGKDKLSARGSHPKFVNPLSAMSLLRNPMLLIIALGTGFVLLTDFAILTPMAYTLGVNYNIKNPALLGACFLPNGLGDIVGAPLAGRISDKIIVQLRERRNGVWYPEDRLRVTLIGALTFAPLSVLFFGIFNQYVPGRVGLILNLICLFMNGVGVQMVLGPASAYLVDTMPTRSAEGVATNNALRSWVISIALTGMIPLIQGIGVARAYAISAVIGWLGFGVLWCIIRYGDLIRSWSAIDLDTSRTH